jgi:translation elongation factor EF-G
VNVNRNSKLEEENCKSYYLEKKKKKKPQKKQKVQRDIESISVQVQDGCQQMEMLNQNAAESLNTCPYIPQQDNNLQQMDMGSRTTANLDGYYLFPQQNIQPPAELSLLASSGRGGYYVNQQVMQPLGQWNSAPMRIQHYAPQQTLQELLQAQLNFRAPVMDVCFNIQDGLQQEDEVEETEQSANVTSKRSHDKHLPR